VSWEPVISAYEAEALKRPQPRPARLVRLGAEPLGPLPLYEPVRRGGRVAGAPVLFVDPPEGGVLAPTTAVEVTDAVEVEVEERGEAVVVRVRPGLASGSREDVFVYPARVWEEVRVKFVEPLSEGRPPMSPGVVFTGPPGTGKSTMLEILARGYGLVPSTLDPSVAGMYVGETERRLSALLEEAEAREPSIILMDECEWLLEARKQAALSGHAAALSGAVSIMLRKMQEWKNRGRLVLVAAATNKRTSDLDQAFLRPGRFVPVEIPLPDAKLMRAYFEERGLDPREAERLARMAVNAGASMAEAAEAVELIRRGARPRFKARREKGYRRLAPPPHEEALGGRGEPPQQLLGRVVPPEFLKAKGARVEVVGPLAEAAALPLLAFYAAELGRPIVEVWAERWEQLDEAVAAAEQSDAVVFARSDYISDALLWQLHLTTACPLFLFGRSPRLPASLRVSDERVVRVDDRFETVLRLLCAYYGVEPDGGVARAAPLSADLRRQLLQALPAFSGSALSKAVAFVAGG